MSVTNTNPSVLFGGTWVQLENRFLLGAGSNYTNGATGGSKDAIVVNHNHEQNSHNHSLPNSVVVYNKDLNRGLVSNASSTKVALNSTLSTPHTAGGTVATNKATGVDGTNKNMPPYLVVYMWKRTA